MLPMHGVRVILCALMVAGVYVSAEDCSHQVSPYHSRYIARGRGGCFRRVLLIPSASLKPLSVSAEKMDLTPFFSPQNSAEVVFRPHLYPACTTHYLVLDS